MKASIYFKPIAGILSIFLFIPSIFALDYTVKTIYFIPNDVEDRLEELELSKNMKIIQQVYKQEMDDHGFSNKTFRLEMDCDEVVIHKIKGKFDKSHYFTNTIGPIKEELKVKFPNWDKNIFAIVVAGLTGMKNGISGVASAGPGGWSIEGKDHGFAFSIESDASDVRQILMHELGHTFGLWHIALYDKTEFILGGYGEKLSLHEAHWLAKSRYFNTAWNFSKAPTITKFYEVESIGGDKVRFKWDVNDPDELYQAYAFVDADIVGWDFLCGINDTAEFNIPRNLIPENERIWLQLMDEDGNWNWYDYQYTLPEPTPIVNSQLKHLTIRHNHPYSLTPINNQQEWVGWQGAGIFEKMPDGNSAKLPDWYIHVPQLDEWDSWIYSHAISRLVYFVSGGEYNRFSTFFCLPNPCDNRADVQIICFADDVEIYRSEVLRAPDAQNKHIQVDFPKDTETFTIQVTDAGDGISCDHFAFGEAHILQVDESEQNKVMVNRPPKSINPSQKLTTSWAKVKFQR